MKRIFSIIACVLFLTPAFAQREVLYSVDISNFYDSDGDGNGDIKGVREKLSDLQYLGVTTIVLSTVYGADATGAATGGIEKINLQYGNFKEYRDLIQEVHNRKMKLYQTVNLQYINVKHVWFADSFKNTKSDYNGYLAFADKGNEKPLYKTASAEQNATVNLSNAKVVEYYTKTLKYWADPDGNGVFYDAADGFIFKDCKDRLVAPHEKMNQYKDFYEPLWAMLKKVNPDIQIITDTESTTSPGQPPYARAGKDGVVANTLGDAIRSLKKANIIIAADSTFNALPADNYAVLKVEDKFTARVASLGKVDAGKLKVIAALNILIGARPMLYYGQETGVKEPEAKNPVGGAVYKEMQKDKNSLWNYYKELMRIKVIPVFSTGAYKEVHNDNNMVVSFLRIHTNEKTGEKTIALVMVNLSDKSEVATIDRHPDLRISRLKLTLGTPTVAFPKGGAGIELPPYCVQVWTMIPY